MKQKILNFLVWLMDKLDPTYLTKCSIGTKTEVNWTHYVPNDGKWHHCALTLDYWLKVGGKNIVREHKFADGKQVYKTVKEIK